MHNLTYTCPHVTRNWNGVSEKVVWNFHTITMRKINSPVVGFAWIMQENWIICSHCTSGSTNYKMMLNKENLYNICGTVCMLSGRLKINLMIKWVHLLLNLLQKFKKVTGFKESSSFKVELNHSMMSWDGLTYHDGSHLVYRNKIWTRSESML